MQNTLILHIEKFITLEPSDVDKLESCLEVSKVTKKEHVLKQEQICNTIYFVVKCKFRLY